MMSGVRSAEKSIRLRVLFLLAGTAGALAASGLPALAQQTSALRGEISESDIYDQLLTGSTSTPRTAGTGDNAAANARDDGIPSPSYTPESQGAVPEERPTAEGASIFDSGDPDQASDDIFADAPRPEPRAPSTATERAKASREDAETPADPAARKRAGKLESEQDETTTGTVRVGTVDSDVTLKTEPDSERAEAIEGLERTPEENPYQALGIRAGSFILRPTLETGITATSNADYSQNGASAILSESTLRLDAASDWSRHAASINAYGTLRRSISGAKVDEKYAGVDGRLRFDLGNEFTALASLGYTINPESASSPVVIVGTVGRPIKQTLTGSLGLAKEVGKLRLGLTGNVERDWYGDAELSAGGMLSQRDRNFTLGTVVLRTGYEISPALTPFVEGEIGRRSYELRLDSSGYERSSDRLAARAGIELDLGEKLSGEFSAGWLREKFDDDRLPAISGATVNADLDWSPQRGTTIGLSGSTTVEGSTTAGESGSILYSGNVNVERQIRANLTGALGYGAGYRDYTGSNAHDLTLSAEAGVTYWLNRYAGITGRVRHEQQTSNLPGRDYKVESAFLGLRFQR
jgi:hypothetical protein